MLHELNTKFGTLLKLILIPELYEGKHLPMFLDFLQSQNLWATIEEGEEKIWKNSDEDKDATFIIGVLSQKIKIKDIVVIVWLTNCINLRYIYILFNFKTM